MTLTMEALPVAQANPLPAATVEAAPLRVAVVGVGNMGRNHARVYSQMPGVQLVAVHDVDLPRAEAVAAQYGCLASDGDLQQLIDACRIEAVSIATPTRTHAHVAHELLSMGVHVLVEKPLADTAIHAWHLCRMAETCKRVLAVGHIERYNPAVRVLREDMAAGRLGRIYEVQCRRAGPFTPRERDTGVTLDLAVHDLDLLRWLLGEEPQDISAAVLKGERTKYDDLMAANLTFPSGVIAFVSANWLCPAKERQIGVLAEHGLWRLDLITQTCRSSWARYWDPWEDGAEPLVLELGEFVKACRGEPAEIVTGEDGLAAVALAEQILERAKEGAHAAPA